MSNVPITASVSNSGGRAGETPSSPSLAGRRFNKAAVQKYRAELETKGLAPSSINVRQSAIRRLALEAADNGVMAPELAAGIARAKGAKRGGMRLGH